jgi:hypothetical protein
MATDPPEPDRGRLDGFVFREPRAGDLTAGWRILMIAAWIMVFFAYAAVWKASDEIGIGTWWLGSRSQPTPIPVRLIPFLIAFALTILATYNVRRLPWIATATSLLLAVMATFDFAWSAGLAVVELGVALGALLTALGSFTGTYRLGPSERPGVEEPVTG